MDFLKILKALSESDAEFVIVGGVAARLYGSTRLTHDIDIVPRLEPETWPALVELIWKMGGRPRIPEPLSAIQDLRKIESWIADKGMLALSFRAPDGATEIDLLVAESSRFDSLQSNARSVVVEGQTYLIAGLDDLIEMKQRAGRPQDLLDIEQLEDLRQRIEPGDSDR